jgi:magnesium-transporting ATPase (P-type)
MYRATPDTIE